MQNQSDLYPIEDKIDFYVSPRMIETLRKCYKIESAFPGKPYGPKDLKESFSGLYKRGLLEIDLSNKKLKTGKWYITTKGLQLLVSVSSRRMNINDPFLINNIKKLKHNLEELQNSIHNLKVTSGRINKKIA